MNKQYDLKLMQEDLLGLNSLPYSLEAEQSVLGGLIVDNDAWNTICDKVGIDDFYSPPHRQIFFEIHNLLQDEKPIDVVTLADALERRGKLQAVGGFAYIAELAKNTPTVSNIVAYAEIVHEYAIRRVLILAARDIAQYGYQPQGRTIFDLLNIAESKMFQIAKRHFNKTGEGPKRIDKVMRDTVKHIENLYQSKDGIRPGTPTGYTDLDKKIIGLQNSDLVIIAARPSMGKTTFALNICENIAMSADKPVLIFSLEMPANQLMLRMLSSLSRVDQTKLRTGQLADEDWARISSSMSLLLERHNMYIDDSSELTPYELRARAQRVYRQHQGISLIMIDYLQLMRTARTVENRVLEITEISRSLKSLAKELNVPILALSQLNRSVEQRADKRPVNSDLRESGAIEQDADLVMFIYRDEVYNESSEHKGLAEIIIGKHRNGPTGSVKLFFNGNCSRFDNYSPATTIPSDCEFDEEIPFE